MRWVLAAVMACPLIAGCGDDQPRTPERVSNDVAGELPTSVGELWSLCPPPDVPQDFFDSEQRKAERATRALIREVRAHPEARVTLISHDAHTQEVYRDEMTVRELAEEHLNKPGARGVPCRRSLMLELKAAVEGRPAPAADAIEDERVYTFAQVARALELRKDGAVHHGPYGCQVEEIFGSRSEMGPTLRDGAGKNRVLVTDPDETVGVRAYQPSAACERYLERRLTALASQA